MVPWIVVVILVVTLISALLGFPLRPAELIIFGLVWLGAYLAWTAEDRSDRWGDVGRSLLLGALLAFAFGLYDRAQQKDEKKREFRQTISLQQTLRGADFSEDDLSDLQLVGKDLVDADLSGADLSQTNLTRADLSGAQLDGAEMSGTDLTEAVLNEASFDEADLDEATLLTADAERADFEGASLRDADLVGANLSNACFANADLSGANSAGAEFYGAQFAGANVEGTVFEEDFRPAALGPTTENGSYVPAPGFHAILHADQIEPSTFKLPEPIIEFQPDESLDRTQVSERSEITAVPDGDTVRLDQAPARLLGINAPGTAEDHGDEAQAFLERYLGRTVEVQDFGQDEFGRRLVFLWVGEDFVNRTVVVEGHATYLAHDALSPSFGNELLRAEESARARALGVWTDCPPR